MSVRPTSPTADDPHRAIVERDIAIDAPADVIFESILDDMRAITGADDKPMNFVLEAFPGGRWFRDLGDNAGHFWGHVQVIKPPTLLEIYGPLMVSSPAISHVTWRVTPEGTTHRLSLKHRIFGEFDPRVPTMVGGGWQGQLDRVKRAAETRRR